MTCTLRAAREPGAHAACGERCRARTWWSRSAYHHLKLAGRDDALFSDDAVGLIHQTSRGYPRAVNNLALQALVAAFAANKAIVDESSTRTAIAEVTAD